MDAAVKNDGIDFDEDKDVESLVVDDSVLSFMIPFNLVVSLSSPPAADVLNLVVVFAVSFSEDDVLDMANSCCCCDDTSKRPRRFGEYDEPIPPKLRVT